MGQRHHMMGGEWMNGMGIIGILVILMLVAITVLVIFAIIRMSRENKQTTDNQQHPDNEALSVLKKRFAQGEISEEEYKRMKDVLKEK